MSLTFYLFRSCTYNYLYYIHLVVRIVNFKMKLSSSRHEKSSRSSNVTILLYASRQ